MSYRIEQNDIDIFYTDISYLKTAKMIDESLILAILRNYSTKPSYIFQLKREIQV
jgi:hypothetical protein